MSMKNQFPRAMHRHSRNGTERGVTLVELMITLAVLTIVVGIAIPAYNAYISEARLGAARANMESIRIALEDYRLDNGDYAGAATHNEAALASTFGWTPDGDQNAYDYYVYSSNTNGIFSYDMAVVHKGSGVWMRCDNRMDRCCDGGGNGFNSACP